jgi:hypothetical protein
MWRRVVALALIVLVGSAGCAGCTGSRGPGLRGVAIQLNSTTDVPRAFRELGVRAGWRLPRGWSVDWSGVRRSGAYLIFAGFPTDPKFPDGGSAREGQDTYTWVVNARSGRGYRYREVDQGWYARYAVGAGGWVVREEMYQRPGVQCACFAAWRLFAQRIGHGTPRLLAQSRAPGSEANAPVLATDDRTIVWEQSSDGKHYGIYQWTPGSAHAQRVLVRTTPGEPEFDGHRLYLLELPKQRVSETPTNRVLELTRRGTALKARTLGTFVGQSHSQVRAGTILHFPANGVTRGRWYQARFTSSSDDPVGIATEGPYTAIWISHDQFLSWSFDGWDLMSTRSSDSKQIAGSNSRFAIPRTDGQHLALGMNDYHGTAIVGSTLLR